MNLSSLRTELAARATSAFDALAGRVDVFAARTLIGPSLARRAAAHERRSEAPREHGHFVAPELPKLRLFSVPTMRSAVDVMDARWGRGAANELAAARLFLHRAPARSAVLLVHGYLGGRPSSERWLWPVHRLLSRGHDVALVTLPEHGARAPGAGSPGYPNRHPSATVLATRQAIAELGGLLRFFAARGAMVGAAGASLGGYLVALLATVEPDLSFAIPVVPLSDLTAFASGHLPDTECRTEMLGKSPDLVHAYDAVSPLVRRPVIARDRMVVLAARADRVAPLAHAKELAHHFGCPLEVFPGGHWLQPRHGRLVRAVDRLCRVARWTSIPPIAADVSRGRVDFASLDPRAVRSP